jgi:4-hydroxy-3-methylbut-2-enyl diphosphate reductase
VPWDELRADDVVVVPAFGTTLELQERLSERHIDAYRYNTTCPFVEKVWKRSAQLGSDRYSVVVHGKDTHEETRATFSHSRRNAPTVVVLDLNEARILGDVIRGARGREEFFARFGHKCSPGFDPDADLERIGVVNQTTMLATETHEIALELRRALVDRHGVDAIGEHFADTSDTLCYATYENQNATYALIEHGAALAIVVGGFNSSNTSHIVELCAQQMPTYFIQGAEDIVSVDEIRHFRLETRSLATQRPWLPAERPVDVVLTCGASCPDAILDDVLRRVVSFMPDARSLDHVLTSLDAPTA